MPRRTDIRAKVERLRAFFAKEKRMPGYNEMLKLFDYRSKNAVHGLLDRLRKLGYVRKIRGKLSPTGRLTGTIRLLGTVQAGFPSPAEEELADVLSLDEFLVKKPEATYMLKVSGDSMSEAGIYPGDIALVERGCTPKQGDIVVAQVDGEWTMKFFTKDATGICLEPANRKYTAIRPKESFVIGGIVRTVIRKYE